ncbi:hypothetical protein JYU34_000255 [Plutella xylostella]|uniref:Uncharacterized protein n=1 Tax=Plutella xylostella TaxID=51655 RepID=A0ABQ7R784_PLUXY|nr:hypothetical protein JYU34_000255 [Plutella xylostella]
MAYNLEHRFPGPHIDIFIGPGSYEHEICKPFQQNKYPFNSSKNRDTLKYGSLYTEAIYYAKYRDKIPLGTSLQSKTPRFPYELFSKEDMEELLCRCGVESPCICDEGKVTERVVCQAKVPRRLFIGSCPNSPGRRHVLMKPNKPNPDFYNATVNEFTKFYHGCKWSKWTSKREIKSLETRPGPADYHVEKKTTAQEICNERMREYHRMSSKQPRYIEMVQNLELRECRPGPASYYVKTPQCPDLKFYGGKAERFPESKYEITPGPADQYIKRLYDSQTCEMKCPHVKLPAPAGFSVKAPRFRNQHHEGPGPADYNIKRNLCAFMHCSTAPFGVSSKRFVDDPTEDFSDEELDEEEEIPKKEPCVNPTWQFKSNAKLYKPLIKKLNDPSPADFLNCPCGNKYLTERPPEKQYAAPFYSSDGRFLPWYSWVSICGKSSSPGPGYYELNEPKCRPAFKCGPLYKTPRFNSKINTNPAPNEYNIETEAAILNTFNVRLKNNLSKRKTLNLKPRKEKKHPTKEDIEMKLYQQSIELLDEECV